MKKESSKKTRKMEDVNIISFLEFYLDGENKNSEFKLIPGTSGGKSPDCYVPSINTLIEVKGIHDAESNEKIKQWEKIVNNLQTYISKSPNFEQIKGFYLINTPFLKFPSDPKSLRQAADQILEAIIKNLSTVTIKDITFDIKKISNNYRDIRFGVIDGGSINPAGVIYQNISNKIETANQQLKFEPENKKVKKRILLLVNQYIFTNRIDEVVRGLSFAYEKILTYENIDEIWLQTSKKGEKDEHTIICTKEFMQQYNTGSLNPSKYNIEVFERWFSSLVSMGDEHKKKLFSVLRILLKEKKPCDLFKNKFVRQEMVQLGAWLIDKNRFDDAIWLIDQFINDPDPEDPDKYSGDPKFNYHQQIIDGETSIVITTVLGHLAWIVQRFALKKDYILQAFEYTKTLLKHNNYYVKQQAIILLGEISAHRQWLEEYDRQHNINKYGEFHDVSFGLLRNYSNFFVLAEGISHIFYYYKDITTEEAIEILDRLKTIDSSASLFIYFALYRKNHYKDRGIFNPEPLEEKLCEAIKDKNEKSTDLRSSIAWNFQKLLSSNSEEFDTVKQYIDLFFKQAYAKKTLDHLFRIIKEWIDKKPDICILWFEQMISSISEYVKDNKRGGGDIWLRPEKIIEIIAKEKPHMLLNLMTSLISFWEVGAYIGNLNKLFNSYELISDSSMKAAVVKKFKKWHKNMKTLNPRLPEVEWN